MGPLWMEMQECGEFFADIDLAWFDERFHASCPSDVIASESGRSRDWIFEREDWTHVERDAEEEVFGKAEEAPVPFLEAFLQVQGEPSRLRNCFEGKVEGIAPSVAGERGLRLLADDLSYFAHVMPLKFDGLIFVQGTESGNIGHQKGSDNLGS